MKFINYFVQCGECGAVVGIVPNSDTNAMIRGLKKQIEEIKRALPQK